MMMMMMMMISYRTIIVTVFKELTKLRQSNLESDTFNCAFQFPVDSTTAIAE